jgi:hypothetical protein
MKAAVHRILSWFKSSNGKPDPKRQWIVEKDGRWGLRYIDACGEVTMEAELLPLSGSWVLNPESIREWNLDGKTRPIEEEEKLLIVERVKVYFFERGIALHLDSG